LAWYTALSSNGDTSFKLTGTNQCDGAEGVSEGTDPGGGSEEAAIASDMIAKCVIP
jgi:hypothetical protein